MLKDYPFVENENFSPKNKNISLFGSGIIAKKQLTTFQISNSKKFMITQTMESKFNNIKILNPSKR